MMPQRENARGAAGGSTWRRSNGKHEVRRLPSRRSTVGRAAPSPPDPCRGSSRDGRAFEGARAPEGDGRATAEQREDLTMLVAVRTSLLTVGAVYLVVWALGLLG
jgi:hypothetical protein